ncbi:MAG: riboflavin biosynthesis protein RibF [Syntrophus sp. (in: bacteria)]|nr:riboflavin biosynthesis protein RibF [Syntrophus sp. (in: bacteria)]
MKIFETLNIAEKFPNPVLTVGNYDGLHTGHRMIIEKVKAKAAEIGGASMLMTFNPHPMSLLAPEKQIGLITPVHAKKRIIEETGIDVLILAPFTPEFRAIDPEHFVKDILLGRLGIKGLIVGYDFKFGKGGKGDVHLLRRFSDELGFFFDVVDVITLHGEKIGSNRIRKMIKNGETERLIGFLGRPHMIEGRVVKGLGRGAGLGFPTINLETDFDLIPKEGVYVTQIEMAGVKYPAVTNIGRNPTFDGKTLTIETFILDFSGNLYGQEVSLYFYQRIRDEMRFGSVDELLKRISLDVEIARGYFRNNQDKEGTP